MLSKLELCWNTAGLSEIIKKNVDDYLFKSLRHFFTQCMNIWFLFVLKLLLQVSEGPKKPERSKINEFCHEWPNFWIRTKTK